MRSSLVIVAVCTLSVLLPAMEKPEGWLPITQEERDIKDVPGYSGSAAIRLYFDYYKDDNDKFETVYSRIKVLRPAGMTYADVEIPVVPGATLKTLAARTIHPDGTIVDFTGKSFEKTIIKTRGVKFSARTFAFPAVTVGSILEYRYTLVLPRGVVQPVSKWPIQGPLFTVKAHFRFRAYQGLVMVPSEWANLAHHSRVSYAYLNQVDATIPDKKAGNLMEMELANIPPFQPEDYMPPEEDYKPTLLFYYGGRETASPDQFWSDGSRSYNEWMEKSFGDRREIREAAEQAAGSETDPEKKLHKLYARVQQIRNVTFERPRTEEELKKEGLKLSNDASDALKRGYGTAGQITRLFVAMARAAGFDAYVIWMSSRNELSFVRDLLLYDQIDSEAALVKLNGKDVILDPGTRYCPYGLLRWMNTATPALKVDKSKAAEFVSTPGPQMSTSRRTAKVALAADGSLKGEITLEMDGEGALESRLEASTTDEAGRRKALEDELMALLPKGAAVKMQDSQGWESSEGPITARFTVEIPDFASATGKRLVVPALLFSTLQKGMFTGEIRRYPIVFSYPFTEIDEVAMKLPEGYTLDAPPYRRKSTLSYAGYEVSSSFEDNQLVTKRSLRIEGASFPPEKYYELKNLFAIVLAGDGGQAVLQKAQPVAQQ